MMCTNTRTNTHAGNSDPRKRDAAGGRAVHGGARAGGLRAHRRAREQRGRAGADRRAERDGRRRLARRLCQQRRQRLLRRARGAPVHDAQPLRPHHQRLLQQSPQPAAAPRRIHGQQGRRRDPLVCPFFPLHILPHHHVCSSSPTDLPQQVGGQGGGTLRHHGQLCRPQHGPHRHDAGEHRALRQQRRAPHRRRLARPPGTLGHRSLL